MAIRLILGVIAPQKLLHDKLRIRFISPQWLYVIYIDQINQRFDQLALCATTRWNAPNSNMEPIIMRQKVIGKRP